MAKMVNHGDEGARSWRVEPPPTEEVAPNPAEPTEAVVANAKESTEAVAPKRPKRRLPLPKASRKEAASTGAEPDETMSRAIAAAFALGGVAALGATPPGEPVTGHI